MEGISEDADINAVLTKMLSALLAPAQIKGSTVSIGASVGVAVFPRDGHDAESLLRSADAAMYRAKQAGRGRFEYCAPPLANREKLA